MGVDLFFVLSGYLIASGLFSEMERTNHLRFGRFFMRRALRIYPPFFFLLFITALVLAHRSQLSYALPKLLIDILFVQNYWHGQWEHTWSLAVEEHFYLALPLLLIALNLRKSLPCKQRLSAIPVLYLVTAIMTLLLRIETSISTPYGHHTHHYPTHLRIDSLMAGVVIAYWHQFSPKFSSFTQAYSKQLFCIGITLLLPFFFYHLETTPFIYTYGFTIIQIGCAALVTAALGAKASIGSWTKPFRVLAMYSYSIYLWHYPLNQMVFEQIHFNSPWTQLSVYLVVSIIVGIRTGILVERTFLRLRDRLFPQQVSATV